ncbi:MAG: hypothetical protein A2487_02550 [Candidatus Raymondbacteria bacterium RifOxyC12_full_50_8]|uniref:Uncharacterized protein n=1 Tax=Candidatus Raymondbacteria bacterium RIFOXYD12_FULL_49_13 TaxID=1817890 RepID=A0A1F7FIJ6_UNCRA|nr:MAG: hypothetical protein A2248_21090 [Candidatus Raymondbacteria bacterium RIFOXYA2_FULL_49_16]OGJ95709.1 MAG: hypothetical protein A2350_12280 [Candidatus Raymondbacteria bacterium RifOxyB12_full_50_8]OGK06286.1 MAG: hypothetical protein A2519_08405 [Candidatus Raymondbacteria bacterium RIFOXYD12_FULL_49_13]OGK07740.1 MAG: hypothetical protein A2487_02550 [Candidatus Raymondbacteria bacterium RifOxyC12_full_50_8]OGP40618.1 MAG: hypothetical protein A2324_03160 [Candidatus Raymondbacteria b
METKNALPLLLWPLFLCKFMLMLTFYRILAQVYIYFLCMNEKTNTKNGGFGIRVRDLRKRK